MRGYNYQIPILSPTHQDALQSRFNKTLGSRDQIYGRFAFQSTRTDTPNLFGFLDTTEPAGHQHQRQLVAPFEPAAGS